MIVTLLWWMLAGLAGAIAHELAHWGIWRATGRQPRLLVWQLEVRPTAGPEWTTTGDRIAAVAPYVLGTAAIWLGFKLNDWALVIFGAFQCGIPSEVDVQTALGKSEWKLDGA